MDLETTQTNAVAKLPLLKQGEYEMWRLGIEQYFQIQDYAIWDVIENGNSFKPTARTTANADGTSTSLIPGPVTTKEKAQKKNDVKVRNAKTLFAAIQTRFGGNDATKKTQKTLLKRIYENFNAPSTELLDSIFNSLQKIVSQLAILDLDSMSFDDLYNNFKIVEQEVKRTATSSSSSGSQNMAFVLTPSSTNDVNTANVQVSTANSSVSTDSTLDSTANLSDATVYAFLANQPNSISRKLGRRSLSMEVILQDITSPRPRNQYISRRTLNVEDTSSKAMVAIDGAGFYWSFMAKEEMTTNMALMAFSDSEPEVQVYGPKASKSVCVDTSNEVKKTFDTPLVEELVLEKEKQTVFPTKIEFVKQQDKTARKPVNYDHVQAHCKYHQREGMVYGNKYNRVNYNYTTNRTHPNTQRNMVPRAVLMKTSLKSFNTVRTVNTAHPKSTVYSAKPMSCFSKIAQSTVKRPYQSKTVLTNKKFTQKVNTTKAQAVNTVRPKVVNTARQNSAVVNAVRDNQANVVKASACWGNPPTDDQGYMDSGCSRHMAGNISYLLDFQEFDGGYVTFGKGVRGGKITGKGTLKMGKLDFQKNNMYSVDMKNIVPKESLTCLVAKATIDESMLWHRRLGHINFKTINKLVKDNLVRSFPSKRFKNDQTCVACLKGKQYKASCKSKVQNSITQPLFMLHIDLFGPTFVSSLMNKKYCLVVTDDYSRFTWVFFLASKDETCGILKNFITKIENLVDKKVKIIRCDNGTEFKNRVMNEFCEQKGIKREYSAEVVNTACYVRNRVIIIKPHKKTPYELFRGRTPALRFMRPFRCHVSILNTLDHLGKFNGKFDDGFFVGYSMTSKAFRVYNIRTRRVEENLHIRFLEDKPIVTRDGPKWLFDINGYTNKETDTSQDYIVMPLWKYSSLFDSLSMNVGHDEPEPSCDAEKKDDEGVSKESGVDDQERPKSSTPNINTASAYPRTGSLHINTVSPTVITTRSNCHQSVSDIFSLRDNVTPEATNADLFGDETEMDMSNLNASYHVPTTPNTRIHKDHSLDHVIGDIQSGVQTRGMTKTKNEQGLLIVLMDLPKGKRAIGTKWIFRNKKDERGIVIRNKARLVAQRYTQEEGIDYDEVFAPVARIKAIRLFLAYASFMGFMVYQMDVKSAFLYGQIEKDVYVCQPPGFEDLDYPNKDFKVVKALYGLHQAPRAWTASTPMDTEKPLLKDSDGDDVYVHLYRSMIESLMYLTSSRPDIMFVVCPCARFQVTPKVSHSHAVNRIFRYLKGKPNLGLWYPRDSPFDLVAYSDSDYARASLHRKSTIGGCQFLGCRLISWQCKKQTVVATSSTEAEYVAAASCCGQAKHIQYLKLNASPLKHVKRGWDTKRPQSSSPPVKVGDEAVHKELGDRMERVATTASSLEAEQDSEQFLQTAALSTIKDGVMEITATIDGRVKTITEASIRRHLKLEDSDGISTIPTVEIFEQLALIGTYPTPTLTQKQFSNMKRASKGYSGVNTPLFQTMLVQDQGEGPTITVAAPMPFDSPLPKVHSLRSDEGSLSLNELTVLCTSLSKKVESLESELKQTKQTYSTALTKLIKWVKKLEQTIKTSQARRRAKVMISNVEENEEDSSKQGRSLIEEMDLDSGISLVPPQVADQGRFDDTQVSDQPEEQLGVFSAAKVLTDAAEQRRDVENVQTYTRRRRSISTGNGGVSTTSELVSTASVKAKDKGKSVMQESEPPKKIKKRV
ncbi:putative ribonuclease H-like domain-containing protein [Tanacetum coccineum]